MFHSLKVFGILCGVLFFTWTCAADHQDNNTNTLFTLSHLSCDSLSVFNYEAEQSYGPVLENGVVTEKDFISLQYRGATSSEAKFNNYRIALCTSERVMVNPDKPLRYKYEDPILDLEKNIKKAYLDWDYKLYHFDPPYDPVYGDLPVFYYHSDVLKSLTVTSSNQLFGLDAGTSLNDYIEIGTYGDWSTYGIIARSDYSTILLKNQTIPINEYLGLTPLLNAGLLLSFNAIPSELPITTSFTIELILENGKRLINSTKNIQLN